MKRDAVKSTAPDGGERDDLSWDGVWDVSSRLTDEGWSAELAKMGALEDLQPYFDRWDIKDQIDPLGLKIANEVGGGLFYLPLRLGADALYYRKDWFEEAGLEWSPNVNRVNPSYRGKQFTSSGPGGSGTFTRHAQNFINERENYFHKPQVNLNWYSYFGKNLTLSTVAYYSGGNGGGTGTYGSSSRAASASDRAASASSSPTWHAPPCCATRPNYIAITNTGYGVAIPPTWLC